MKELTGNPDLLRPIADLGFSTRIANAFRLRLHISRVGELVACADWEILRTQDLGQGSLQEIKDGLFTKLGLGLGMVGKYRFSDQHWSSEATLRAVFQIPAEQAVPTKALFQSFATTRQEGLFERPSSRKGQLDLGL